MLNLYQILDIDETASQSEIISASEKLVEEWDPSKVEDRKNRAIVAGVLREILDARDVLSDLQKRKAYDVSIGLADIVYKESSAKSQNVDENAAESRDYTTQVHIPTTDQQGTESDAEEFYDSNSELTTEQGKATLNVNLKEATSSDPYTKVYKTGSSGNTNEHRQMQSEQKPNDSNGENVKMDDGKVNGSLEKVDGASKQNDLKLENQQQYTETLLEKTNSKTFTEIMSSPGEADKIIQDSQTPKKDSESAKSSESLKDNEVQNGESSVVDDSDPSAKGRLLHNIRVIGLLNKTRNALLTNSDLSNNATTSSTAEDQNSNVPKPNESETLDDVLKQESKPSVLNGEVTEKPVSDISEESNTKESEFVKSAEKLQLGTENETLLYVNKDALQKSLEAESSSKGNSLSPENKNGSNSMKTSKEDLSQNINKDAKSAEQSNDSKDNHKKSSNDKLIENDLLKPVTSKQANEINKSNENPNKDFKPTDLSKNDINTEEQNLSPENQKASRFVKGSVDNSSKIRNASNHKRPENRFVEPVAVSIVEDEDKTSENLNKDVIPPKLSKIEVNSEKHSEPSENKNESNSKISDEGKISQASNASISPQTSNEKLPENRFSKPVNATETEEQNKPNESLSKAAISKMLSKIGLSTEEENAFTESQNELEQANLTKTGEQSKSMEHLSRGVLPKILSKIGLSTEGKDASVETQNELEQTNLTKTGEQSKSTEHQSRGVLPKILSKIGLSTEEKDASVETQNKLNSETEKINNSTGVINVSNNGSPNAKQIENQQLKTTSESKSGTFNHPSKDSRLEKDISKSEVNKVNSIEQQNKASKADNFSSKFTNEFETKLPDENLGLSNAETETFSSETVWKRDESKNIKESQESKEIESKEPEPAHSPMKSVSASTRSRGSETKTVYFFGPDGERVEVYVDGKMRVQVSKSDSEHSYTSDWQNSASPTPTNRLCASTTIDANGAKLKTMRICDGKQETISVHKDYILLCKISSRVK